MRAGAGCAACGARCGSACATDSAGGRGRGEAGFFAAFCLSRLHQHAAAANALALVPYGPPTAPAAAAAADDELNRAIALSMQEHTEREEFAKEIAGGRGYKDPANPLDRQRASFDLPAGIKVGFFVS